MGNRNCPLYLAHTGFSEILAPLSFLSLCLKQNSPFSHLLYADHFVQNRPHSFYIRPQSKPINPWEAASNPPLVRLLIQTSWAWEVAHRGVLQGRPFPWPCCSCPSSSNQSNSALSVPETALRVNTEEQRNEFNKSCW